MCPADGQAGPTNAYMNCKYAAFDFTISGRVGNGRSRTASG